jgi:hypothetical protein
LDHIHTFTPVFGNAIAMRSRAHVRHTSSPGARSSASTLSTRPHCH